MAKIKDFIGMTVGVVLGGVALGAIGTHMVGGIGRATQTLVSGGLLSHAANIFKWK